MRDVGFKVELDLVKFAKFYVGNITKAFVIGAGAGVIGHKIYLKLQEEKPDEEKDKAKKDKKLKFSLF